MAKKDGVDEEEEKGEGNERKGLSELVGLVDTNDPAKLSLKRMWLNTKAMVTEDPALKQHVDDKIFCL